MYSVTQCWIQICNKKDLEQQHAPPPPFSHKGEAVILRNLVILKTDFKYKTQILEYLYCSFVTPQELSSMTSHTQN